MFTINGFIKQYRIACISTYKTITAYYETKSTAPPISLVKQNTDTQVSYLFRENIIRLLIYIFSKETNDIDIFLQSEYSNEQLNKYTQSKLRDLLELIYVLNFKGDQLIDPFKTNGMNNIQVHDMYTYPVEYKQELEQADKDFKNRDKMFILLMLQRMFRASIVYINEFYSTYLTQKKDILKEQENNNKIEETPIKSIENAKKPGFFSMLFGNGHNNYEMLDDEMYLKIKQESQNQ